MDGVSTRAMLILGCVTAIAFLVIASILLGGLLPQVDRRRRRWLLWARAGMQALAAAVVLLIAWLVRTA
ncbi:hypothetical protein [Falsirhodobacter algicola]|uniref:HIG1 domain-containing protein n=1 Tax=Falsirhodobacter algicola TaxID=2692330 RepID=A0A8J8SLJ2_9RHOB|nr:hypothetical protein [Falsirhodobacter algicola]QUS36537.1 hypothetical protein GR316_09850 [Falsirhodobacter algicola]